MGCSATPTAAASIPADPPESRRFCERKWQKRRTGTPVVIVLDVSAMARTAAAIVSGLRSFDPQVDVAGVILNRVGSPRHAALVTEAIEGATGVPVLGALLRDHSITLPERHLGLVPTAEPGRWQAWLADVAERVAATVDLDRVLGLARSAAPLPLVTAPPELPLLARDAAPLIAVAADEAFSFRYEENLDLLRAAGARVALFSPLRDAALSVGTHALYLCVGV